MVGAIGAHESDGDSMRKFSKQMGLFAGTAAAAFVSTLITPTSASAAPDAWQCTPGAFCVYTGDNGTGSVCAWTGDDPDWTSGSSACSWARGTRVQSAFNNGLSGSPVAAYTATSFGGTRAFCLVKGRKINLSGVGTYLRSHTWKC